MPSTVFGGATFVALLRFYSFISILSLNALQYIYCIVPMRLVSQQCCSTEIKVMDSPNSAVYLWSSLPFSFRSPEIDAFILDAVPL